MLHELHVTDLGVIQDVDLAFHPGLNVLTGETGAGKTMITVALALALGRRASSALVREGARTARVQARFDTTPAARRDGWAEDDSVILARTVEADGRSSARAGGQITTASVLERLADGLVEVHGQHESALLRTAAAQTVFLDRFAGAAQVDAVAAHAAAFARLTEVRRELEDLLRSERDVEREADVLAFQIAEIEAAAPRHGELDDLERQCARLANLERLLERSSEAEAAMGADAGAAEALAAAAVALDDVARLDAAAEPLARRAISAREEVADLVRDVRAYRESLDADPAMLDELQGRVAAIRALLRKYGDTEADVLAYLEDARGRAAALGSSGERRAALETEVQRLSSETRERAAAISAGRASAGPRLAREIERELAELGMAGASLSIELVPTAPTPTGSERAEFVFAGGPRQRPMPLAKVASGGELSRTMLACRTVLVDADTVPTLVFDEVDAGIGGAAAAAVGRRLAHVARVRQVIVVTHLPQIAAYADRHIVVRKERGTAVAVEATGERRVAELSRMLAGVPESGAAAAHAEELLAEAGRVKRG
jgi:DNA repair protein RecN (Recombination protein N)